jgi:hypothetical protein
MYCVVRTRQQFSGINFPFTKISTCSVYARNIYRAVTHATYRAQTSVSRWNDKLVTVDRPVVVQAVCRRHFTVEHRARSQAHLTWGLWRKNLALVQSLFRVLRFSRQCSIFIRLPWTLCILTTATEAVFI